MGKLKIVIINLLLFFFFLLIIDNLIYYFSPYFTKNFQKYLSQKSQIRYIIKNNDEIGFIFDEYIYYSKPRSHSVFLSDGVPQKEYNDKFGYSNPENYLSSEEIEVLLIGDSFTQYPDFSRSMRSFFSGKVYSIGMGGQGIYHWKHQYKRFKKIYLKSSNPKIIILNYYENDIKDTLRALKYFKAGYTHSAYYPMNDYNDNFEKINREFSFYDEIYSITRYFVVSYRIREKLSNFFKIDKILGQNTKAVLKKMNVLPKTSSTNVIGTLQYSQECKIKIDRGDPNKKLFSENTLPEVADEIKKMLDLIDFNEIKVFFSYIPAADTIYYEKLKQDELLKNAFSIQKKSSENFKKFFDNGKYPVKYIDLTSQLVNLSKDSPLHPCNGKDVHFSKFGFNQYSKLLSKEVKKYINSN
tara:strand:+ start:3428 stop:4663 length:1236 start_codon:yes stop_codon:yes gene_type:complete